ncbi:DUF3168 domain-containing protein [Tranquillimonas alkanivorans]|uniref:DUF3168 domain-containing protein n=1 Tax=Tranquillimonas alkanivorans TaxID=441119 RepID=A0A1I5RVQ7_9RHOB|nr:DUF3168 domain-containing protein [Tranquillimonas alkanivorans]SFP62669.1 Protein of unknown function [Tranquillimonas alkanivorans]
MSMDLATQKALRNRLIASPEVTALVPATAILDRNQRPAPSPSIILGETQLVDEGTSFQRTHTRVYHTIHVWKQETSLEGVKRICGAIRRAVMSGRMNLDAGYHCADLRASGVRVMRDPDGETSHGVVSVEMLIAEVQA